MYRVYTLLECKYSKYAKLFPVLFPVMCTTRELTQYEYELQKSKEYKIQMGRNLEKVKKTVIVQDWNTKKIIKKVEL